MTKDKALEAAHADLLGRQKQTAPDIVAATAKNRSSLYSALPGEAEVVGWAYRGPRGGLIVTEEKPEHAPEAIPLVTLASLQAMQARAEKAERERDDLKRLYKRKCEFVDAKIDEWEAAEARVKELEEALKAQDELSRVGLLFAPEGFAERVEALRKSALSKGSSNG